MNTFISHVHTQDAQLFNDVLQKLKLIYQGQLKDLSIGEDSRIELLIDEEAKIKQEIEILNARKISISNEIAKLNRYIDSEIQVNLKEISNNSNPIQKRIIDIDRKARAIYVTIDKKLDQYKSSEFFSEKIVRTEKRKHSEELRSLKDQRTQETKNLLIEATRIANDSVNGRISESQQRIRALRNEIQTTENRSQSLTERSAFPDYFRSKVGKLNKTELFNEAPDIAVAIYNAISKCDVFIVIGRSFNQYRRWLEFEMLAAQGLGKPIIGIIPYGQGTPRELESYCDEILSWIDESAAYQLETSIHTVMSRTLRRRPSPF